MSSSLAPYNMANDNAIMLMFILNMVGVSYVFLMNGESILERVKCMFYYESKLTPFNDRTHITKICNALLYIQTIFYATIITISHIQKQSGEIPASRALLLTGAVFLVYACTLLLKRVLFDAVNNILFNKQAAQEWQSHYFFTVKLLGFMLSPTAIAILFVPGIPDTFIKIYLLLLSAIYAYTLFNGLKKIIFTQKGSFLDIFLYLCALEFLPTAVVWKLVLQLNEFITIKI